MFIYGLLLRLTKEIDLRGRDLSDKVNVIEIHFNDTKSKYTYLPIT